MAQVERFGGGGGFIQQGGVGDGQAGQFACQRLEVEERLQPALGDFGLVGRVLGVPAGIFQNVALDDRGGEAIRITHSDEGAENLVLAGEGAQFGQDRLFAPALRQAERVGEADLRRHDLGDKSIQAGKTKPGEHLRRLPGVGADMAMRKRIGRVGRKGGVARGGRGGPGRISQRFQHPAKLKCARRKASEF